MDYGRSTAEDFADAYRQVGSYAGKILKGAKPTGPAGSPGGESRVGHQPQYCKGAGHHLPASAARPRPVAAPHSLIALRDGLGDQLLEFVPVGQSRGPIVARHLPAEMHPALARDFLQAFKLAQRVGMVIDAQVVERVVLAVVDQQRCRLTPTPVTSIVTRGYDFREGQGAGDECLGAGLEFVLFRPRS